MVHIKKQGSFNNNKREGIRKNFFYFNGKPHTISYYKNGVKKGFELLYHADSGIDSLPDID